MATLKQRLHRKNSAGTYDTVHLETSSSVVLMDDGTTTLSSKIAAMDTSIASKLDASGTAASATKLTTARTIRTDLTTTATATFDGTADVTPGVVGTLPIANGGTGVTSLDELGTILVSSIDSGEINEETGVSTNIEQLGNALVDSSIVAAGSAATNSESAGPAASATKLATARSIQTNLASTSTVNFDGTTDITPGITGILPVENGGTGVSSITDLANELVDSGIIAGSSNYVVGTYTGTENYTTTHTITLGFRPRFLIISGQSVGDGSSAASFMALARDSSNLSPSLTFFDSGFVVGGADSPYLYSYKRTYSYIAFK